MSDKGQRRYLLCYDIADPRRLQHVRRTALKYGHALQYSVYDCRLRKSQLKRMIHDLRQCMDENEDDVRIYGLLDRAVITFLGQVNILEGVQLLHSPAPKNPKNAHCSPSAENPAKGSGNSGTLKRNYNQSVGRQP